MADDSLTIRYIKDANNSASVVVLAIQYLVLENDTNQPFTDLTEAEFRIIATDPITGTQSRKLRKTLSGGQLTYSADTGALTGSIFNADVVFIKDDVEYEFYCFVVIDGEEYEVDSGVLDAARVD